MSNFNYEQLFSNNRFSDIDRIDNANQLAFGLRSQLLTSDMVSKLAVGVGIIDYFSPPRVFLPSEQALAGDHFSPLVSELSYYPNTHWQISANQAWDVSQHRTVTAGALLRYLYDPQRLIELGYEYVRQTDATNYDRFHLGYAWSLTARWSGVGYWYYDISDRHSEDAYVGLTYNSCCYGLRFLLDRVYMGGDGVLDSRRYDQRYLVELVLKGLGGVSNAGTSQLIRSTLPAYHDPLRG